MRKIVYITIIFSFAISLDFESQQIVDIEGKYQLAMKYRDNKQVDSCLAQLFEVKDLYLKANFDIASIYYQEYKNYDIAIHFFNSIISDYEFSQDVTFLNNNLNIYKNSLFFLAYIYANDLELYTKGIKAYQKFIAQFPDDELTDDARHELSSLNNEENQIELLKNNLK